MYLSVVYGVYLKYSAFLLLSWLYSYIHRFQLQKTQSNRTEQNTKRTRTGTEMTSGISTLVLSPFHLLTWSLRRFSRTFLFLLSPFSIVIYYSSYVFVPLYGPVQMLPKLEVHAHFFFLSLDLLSMLYGRVLANPRPSQAVYIFCGTAAVIGKYIHIFSSHMLAVQSRDPICLN